MLKLGFDLKQRLPRMSAASTLQAPRVHGASATDTVDTLLLGPERFAHRERIERVLARVRPELTEDQRLGEL
jgi:hypothetical protein